MRGPKPAIVELTPEQRQGLESLIRRHTTAQQVALRARIILSAADGFNNAQIARQSGVNLNTASLIGGWGWLGQVWMILASKSG